MVPSSRSPAPQVGPSDTARAVTPAADPGLAADRRDSEAVGGVVALALLAGLAALFLIAAWPRLAAPLADSDEGINAAVWGAGSRALREVGPLESRLGGVRVDGTRYATHPPLLVLATAATESVAGEQPWSTRAPAWLASLASIGVLYLLARELTPGPVTAACATVAGSAGHMLFVYGGMLDTMVVAFPLAIAVILVWYRTWTDRPPPWWVPWVLASAASLASWQAVLLAGLCGLSTVARWRHRPSAGREAVPFFGGAAIGVVATLAWGYWVYGSLSVLEDKLVRRSGSADAVSVPDVISFQLPWLGQLLGVGLLAWIACAVSLRDPRFRPLAALSLTSVLLYAALLREGAAGHQYWLYWGILPAVIGWSYVVDGVARRLARDFAGSPGIQWGALIALAALVAGVNLTRTNQAAQLIEEGYLPYELVEELELPSGQIDLPYVAEPYRIDDWLRYSEGPPGRPLTSEAELRELAREHPDHVVLVLGTCEEPDPTDLCTPLVAAGRARGITGPQVITAANALSELERE